MKQYIYKILVYVTVSAGIMINITCGRPELPQDDLHIFDTLSICALPGYAEDLAINGNQAYIANGQGGLQIVSIADPESTFIVGEYLTSKSAQGVAVRDSFAFVTMSSSAGLIIINIKNPAACSLVGTDPGYTEYNVCAPPDTYYVYIAAHDFFIIENCSIPQYPYYDERTSTPGDARGVFIDNSLAYIACEQMGLYIYYAARPDSEVVLVGSIDTPSNARNVFVNETYAYIADGRSGLIIVNVSDPANPEIASVFDTPEYANDVFINNNLAYIADGEGGVQIVDIADPHEPTYYSVIETSYANAVMVNSGYIYVADRDLGLMICTEREE